MSPPLTKLARLSTQNCEAVMISLVIGVLVTIVKMGAEIGLGH